MAGAWAALEGPHDVGQLLECPHDVQQPPECPHGAGEPGLCCSRVPRGGAPAPGMLRLPTGSGGERGKATPKPWQLRIQGESSSPRLSWCEAGSSHALARSPDTSKLRDGAVPAEKHHWNLLHPL